MTMFVQFFMPIYGIEAVTDSQTGPNTGLLVGLYRSC